MNTKYFTHPDDTEQDDDAEWEEDENNEIKDISAGIQYQHKFRNRRSPLSRALCQNCEFSLVCLKASPRRHSIRLYLFDSSGGLFTCGGYPNPSGAGKKVSVSWEDLHASIDEMGPSDIKAANDELQVLLRSFRTTGSRADD